MRGDEPAARSAHAAQEGSSVSMRTVWDIKSLGNYREALVLRKVAARSAPDLESTVVISLKSRRQSKRFTGERDQVRTSNYTPAGRKSRRGYVEGRKLVEESYLNEEGENHWIRQSI